MKKYPLNSEGLSVNAVIVTNNGVRAVEYGLTSFNPKLNNQISSDSIDLLKKIIIEEHDVYTFKIPFNMAEKTMINELLDEYGFTLNQYSKTFCKMQLSTDKPTYDKDCIDNEPIR